MAEIIKKAFKRCVSVFLNFPRRHQKNAIFYGTYKRALLEAVLCLYQYVLPRRANFVNQQLKIYPQKMSESAWISFEIVINVASRKRFE